jgi:N-acetyl-gamma-glutamyl-phosphate reductase common form
MAKRFGVSIIGGSGYGAGETIRLLTTHPDIEVCGVVSRSHTGKPIASVHSHLMGVSALSFEESVRLEQLCSYEKSAIILAMPSGLAVPTIKDLQARGLSPSVKILDLSGDLRLQDESIHERFYPEVPFAADIREKCVYGLSELARAEIRSAQFITNPGCLATATILALAPLTGGYLEKQIVVDAKTGTSGAGREPQASMHHPSRADDFTAYKVLQHRHEPEIIQALGANFARSHEMSFVPHLIPVSRGIFVTAYATLAKPCSQADMTSRFTDFYKESSGIRMRSSPPRLVDVVGTNFCDISVHVRERHLVVMSAIDNLGKGMASQAIQNLNILFGLPESTGLLSAALGPV